MYRNNIIVDKNNNVLKLIILILSKKNKYQDSKKSKNTIISVSGVESQRTETAKIVLYLFAAFCSGIKGGIELTNYITLSKKTLKNRQPLRKVIKRLSEIKICYYNNNFKKEKQLLFKNLHLMDGVIYYRINSFFESKLNPRGAGHRSRYIPEIIFQDEKYKYPAKKQIRLILLSSLYIKEFTKSDLKNQRKIYPIFELIEEHLGISDHRFLLNVIEEYLDEINSI